MSLVEPSKFTAGDFLNWIREYDTVSYIDKDGSKNYLSSTDSTLVYVFRNKDNKIEIQASSTNQDYEVLVQSTTSQGYAPGLYYWSAVVTNTTGVVQRQWTVDSGMCEIFDNPNNAGMIEYDGRSHVKKVLDALEAAIEGRAEKQTLDWISYSIAGRSRAIDSRELRMWYAQYKQLYKNELAELDLARGKDPGGRILAQLP